MLSWLRNLLTRQTPPAEAEPEPPGELTLRRWESAETNRLNQGHWSKVTGQPINVDLYGSLETLRSRCAYELANNPTLEGVVTTHATDIVGKEGPALNVLSDDEEYNTAAEKVWADWWQNPVIGKPMHGGEVLRLWVRRLWDSGEFLCQKATKRNPDGPVSLGLKLIHPRRLATPPAMAGDADVAMGVRRTRRRNTTSRIGSRPASFR